MNRYGCLMLYLKVDNWNNILKLIDKNDVYNIEDNKYGLESESHITILYGLHKNIELNKLKNTVIKFCNNNIIDIKLNTLSIFDNKLFNVLKIDILSEGLTKFNQTLKDNFEYTSEYNIYHPHMTLAYLKNEADYNKYINDINVNAIKYTLDKFVYSDPSGKQTKWNIINKK